MDFHGLLSEGEEIHHIAWYHFVARQNLFWYSERARRALPESASLPFVKSICHHLMDSGSSSIANTGSFGSGFVPNVERVVPPLTVAGVEADNDQNVNMQELLLLLAENCRLYAILKSDVDFPSSRRANTQENLRQGREGCLWSVVLGQDLPPELFVPNSQIFSGQHVPVAFVPSPSWVTAVRKPSQQAVMAMFEHRHWISAGLENRSVLGFVIYPPQLGAIPFRTVLERDQLRQLLFLR